MVFVEGDDPPYQQKNNGPHDRPMSPSEKIIEKKKREKKREEKVSGNSAVNTVEENDENDNDDRDESYVTKGYVGQNKGIFQILYERGLYLPKMKGQQTQKNS
jgi:hypothetical protein